MGMRKIVEIDEELCNGCGQCISACAEGAIEVVDGKARLASEIYCDGLGACLGECPQDAIRIVEREAEAFDEAKTEVHLAQLAATSSGGGGCPGTRPRQIERSAEGFRGSRGDSALGTWPIQLRLLRPGASFLRSGDLLLAADCTAFAHGDFHGRFLTGRVVCVACPKLDDPTGYVEKLAEILKNDEIRSLTIVHMEVPCCTGLVVMAEEAIERSGVTFPVTEVTIGVDGEVLAEEALRRPATAPGD